MSNKRAVLGPVALSPRNAAGMRDWELFSRKGCGAGPVATAAVGVCGTSALLLCDEEVYARGPGGDRALVNKLLATNLFRKIDGRWKMAHRHASWHPETTAAREALKAAPEGLAREEDDAPPAGARGPSKEAKGRMTLRRLSGDVGGTSARPPRPSSIPPSLEGINAEAVLGIPAPKEEEPAKRKSEDPDGMIGKIINLSDLMGNSSDKGDGDGDEEDDDSNGLGSAIADMLMGNADADSTTVSGSGIPGDPFITRRVFKIGPEGVVQRGKDQKKDKDGEEEEGTVIDLRGKSEEERREVLSRLATGASLGDLAAPPPAGEEELRRRCIATLRELADSGRLSRKQKRVLLTDIITASARGETSTVEVAYKLLCTGGERSSTEIDTGMEDFTEQCHLFAAIDED